MDFRTFIVAGWLVLQTFYAQQQGIEGIVRRAEGNHMPSPKFHPGPPSGVRGTVCVFGLTNESQVTKTGTAGLYSAVHTRLFRQTATNDSGEFRIMLPPGTYSLFVRKGPLFYATRRDEKNNIAPVEVLPGKMTRVECRVESDHTAAVY